MDIYEKLAREQLVEYERAYAMVQDVYPVLTNWGLRKNFNYVAIEAMISYYDLYPPWLIPHRNMSNLLINAAKRYCSWGLLTREEKLTLIQIIRSPNPGDRIMAEEILGVLWEKNQIRKSNKLKTNNHGKTIQEKGSNPEGDNV
jgi:hypothetical protein